MAFLTSLMRPLAYLSLPVILLRSIAASSPVGRYYVRVFVYFGTLATVATCSIAAAAGMSLIGRRFDVSYIVARIFYHSTRTLLGVGVEVEGEEHLDTRPAVLMANHQSELDVLIVGRLMPKQTSIMAKKSIQYTPLGPFMTMAGSLFVDRGNNARAVRSLEAAGQTMRRRRLSMWMFPEGTRHSSPQPEMLPLKKGGFHLAINAGIPIIPIVTENYWKKYHKGVFDTGTIKVRVLPPISTEGLTPAEVPALIAQVRDQMLAALHDMVPKDSSASNTTTTTTTTTTSSSDTTSDTSSKPAPPVEITTASPFPEAILEAEADASGRTSRASASAPSSNSENGTETSTEEDEGMVLVGRPP